MRHSQTQWVKTTTSLVVQKARAAVCEAKKAQLPMIKNNRSQHRCSPRPARIGGEPIVCTPEDAFRCFMGNEFDVLVAGNCVLQRSEQDPELKQDYSQAFEAD
jgi:Carbamoyltransferase C-terminus